jgi:hypothetical protein
MRFGLLGFYLDEFLSLYRNSIVMDGVDEVNCSIDGSA